MKKTVRRLKTITDKMFLYLKVQIRMDKSLSRSEKMIFLDLLYLSQKYGYCFATNSYFAEIYDVHKHTVSHWFTKLERQGFIEREEIRDSKTKQVIQRRIYILKPKDLPSDFFEECEEMHKGSIGIAENSKDDNINYKTKIKEEEKQNEIFSAFERINGKINDVEKHILKVLESKFGKDFVIYAINMATNKTYKLSYIQTLLNDWKAKEIKSTSQLDSILKKFKNRSKRSKGNSYPKNPIRVEKTPDWLESSNKSWENVHQTATTTEVNNQTNTSNEVSEGFIQSLIRMNKMINAPIPEQFASQVKQYLEKCPEFLNQINPSVA